MKTVLKFALAAAIVPFFALSTGTNVAAQMPMPDACKAEASAMKGMGMSGGGMHMGQMADHQKATMESMQQMHPAMMQAMMAKDPDVAFVCGMIAHHMGAISMSEVELKYGDDQQAKSMAQKIIEAQKKEVEEMTTWVNDHAK